MRYRTSRNTIEATTDDNGVFTVSWPHPAMRYLEASATDHKVSMEKAAERRMPWVATLEVLPL